MQIKKEKTRKLVESALLIAIATVLSELALVELPYGGSITLASMFPVLLIAYRHGTPWGLFCGVCYGAIQQLLGLSTLSYFTTWQSIVAVILLDYVVAFAVIGVGGLFRRFAMSQSNALLLSSVTVGILRYLCHVISGATVWAGLSIPTEAALLYSFAYNATYMLPDTLVLALVAYYIGSMIDFRAAMPRRMSTLDAPARGTGVLVALSGLLLTGGVVFDVVMIFSRVQDAETGEFNFSLLQVERFAGSFWMAILIVSVVVAAGAATLLLTRRHMLSKAAG